MGKKDVWINEHKRSIAVWREKEEERERARSERETINKNRTLRAGVMGIRSTPATTP